MGARWERPPDGPGQALRKRHLFSCPMGFSCPHLFEAPLELPDGFRSQPVPQVQYPEGQGPNLKGRHAHGAGLGARAVRRQRCGLSRRFERGRLLYLDPPVKRHLARDVGVTSPGDAPKEEAKEAPREPPKACP